MTVRRRGVRVLDQVEEVEVRVRGALGEVPGRRRRRQARLGVAAVAGASPRSSCGRRRRAVRFDDRRELGGLEAGTSLASSVARAVAASGSRRLHDGAVERQEPEQDDGRRVADVGEREPAVERRDGRALGEVAAVGAGRR